ncbi:hypothetical protein QU38_02615, partial [Staphylococcus aureus]
MSEEPDQPRFFAYLSLFTFAMLMLVTANNLVQMFFGWEGKGRRALPLAQGGGVMAADQLGRCGPPGGEPVGGAHRARPEARRPGDARFGESPGILHQR